MATFPSSATIQPTYGLIKRSSPVVRTARFGDGYEQRTTLGLNQNPKVFSMTFEVSETDADTIEAFLDARALDNESFEFIPPGEPPGDPIFKFVCESWTKSIPFLDRATINVTFRQVFEP